MPDQAIKPGGFAAVIGHFSKGTTAKIQRIRRGVTIKLFNAVILDTPVDTGRLRGNWQLTEVAPAVGELEIEDKSGGATIAKVQSGVMASEGENALFLTNNLPYAHRIEFEGWSHTKAPEGMVRKNIARFNRLITLEAAKK